MEMLGCSHRAVVNYCYCKRAMLIGYAMKGMASIVLVRRKRKVAFIFNNQDILNIKSFWRKVASTIFVFILKCLVLKVR